MADPTFFTRGNTPTITDSRWFILQRILGAVRGVSGGGGSGTGQAGIVGTDPDPNGIYTAEPGTEYTDILLKTKWTKETGSGDTGWVQYV